MRRLFLYLTEMNKLLLLLIIGALTSCNSSAVQKKLKGCDSLVVTFNVANTDSVFKTVSTTDTKAIQKLSRFMSGKKTELYKCGYDGNMAFFRNGQQVLPVVFKYSEEGCRHFLFDLDNKVISCAMSNEAVDFLQSLSQEKSWY